MHAVFESDVEEFRFTREGVENVRYRQSGYLFDGMSKHPQLFEVTHNNRADAHPADVEMPISIKSITTNLYMSLEFRRDLKFIAPLKSGLPPK
jgi:hypothetical protein